MALPARRARWAGCGGSSAPRPGTAAGRNGVHRRLSSFACRPTRLPPPACARSTPTGIAASPAPARRRPVLSRRQSCPTPVQRPTPPASPAAVDVDALHALVTQVARRRPGGRGVSIPLAGKSSIADHMVIASGRSSRQVASMATKLAERIKQQFGKSVADRGAAGRRLGADRRRRRHRPPVPPRSAHLLQSRADVGVRRRNGPRRRRRARRLTP